MGDWVWWDPQAMALAGKPHPGLPTLLWVAARPGVQSPPGVTRLPLAASCFLPPLLPVGAGRRSEVEEMEGATMLLLLYMLAAIVTRPTGARL